MSETSYLNKSLFVKIRKAQRYIGLYGPSRTLAKIRTQYHMAATQGFDTSKWENPAAHESAHHGHCVGLIGCGSFAFGNIAYFLSNESRGTLRGAMDLDPARARSLASRYGCAYATVSPDEIITDPKIGLVYIASNHATHATYAIQALDAGKDVHIEKPHVVSVEQLEGLKAAIQRNPGRKVFVGFNRPHSPLTKVLREYLELETGPMMINWFVAGHALEDDHWYYDDAEGGRILGNLCHWSDMTLQLVGIDKAFPCRIVPTSGEEAKANFVTAVQFADGTLATLSFSAMGEPFEGVHEVLNIHRGGLMAEIRDFKTFSYNRGATRKTIVNRRRDHGHNANIVNSHRCAIQKQDFPTPEHGYILDTAVFFLAIRQAHVEQKEIWCHSTTSTSTSDQQG